MSYSGAAMAARRRALAAALSVIVLAGCGAQTPSPTQYRGRTELAVSSVLSEVATVRLLLRNLSAGKVPSRYAAIVVTDSDDAANGATSTYSSVDPPPAEQHLFDTVSATLSRAENLIVSARLAVSRDDTSAYPSLVRQLSAVAAKLDRQDKALQ
jgi:hypothetical protein